MESASLFDELPDAPFAAAIPSARDPSRLLPQTVAHRGYKAQWPENSLEGMRAAVQAGAHGIETDVHLTRDGVVVMSHDASLKRCFGVAKRIADCDWEYISTLRSVRRPHVGMPRLSDVLRLLAEEESMQKTWCVLDIKIDDDAEHLLSSMRNVLATAKGPVPWEHRILLGCWNATYMTAARRILPAFPLSHISWSRSYSAHFGAAMPNIGYSLHFATLSGVLGRRFLARARERHHHRNRNRGPPIMTWTVNQDNWMRWLLDRNLVQDHRGGGVAQARRVLDAVITDDPRQFREACARWEDELDGTGPRPGPGPGLASRVRSGWGEVLEAAKFTLLWVVLQAVTRFSKRLDTLPDVMKRKVR